MYHFLGDKERKAAMIILSIALVLVGLFFFVICVGDPELAGFGLTLAGLCFVAAVCFFMAAKSRKKKKIAAQESNNKLQEAIDAASQLTVDALKPVNYGNLVLKEGEEVYFAAPARTFTSKEKITGYTGGSRGVNVHVVKGVNFRVGNHRAKPIRETVVSFKEGDYVVTNRRIVFIGAEEHFEFKLENVSAVKQIGYDAFTIIAGGKSKNITLEGTGIVYAYTVTVLFVNEMA